MKREDIRTFLRDGADAIKCEFDSGRITEFNSKLNKTYPFAWVESLQAVTTFGATGSMLIDTWTVAIHIARLDSADSLQTQYEELIDQCDDLARKLVWQYNNFLYGSSSTVSATATLSDNTTLKRAAYSKISIGEVQRIPFIKLHADCLTGVILSFNLTSPDSTDVC